MKRLLLPLLLIMLMLLALPALAESPAELGEPLQGVYTWPEGIAEDDALYVYRYCYPQLAGESDLAMHFNSTYAYTVEDALGFEVPMLASDMQEGDPQKVVEITYEITCMNADYLSVLICKTVTVDGESTAVYAGHVFALTGSGAGRIINLPIYLGLLDAAETDEWLLTRQTNKADKLVRELIWDKIEASLGNPCYDDLTYEEIEAGFYPEEDFYLDGNGEPVFYFQPGAIAPEEEGLVTFPHPLDDLLDEL